MTGENGTPETPDWDIEQTLAGRLANENGVRHDFRAVAAALGIDLTCPCETGCDVCDGEMNRSSAHDGFGTYPIPDNIVLGAE